LWQSRLPVPAARRQGWGVHALFLMGNHFLLVVETPPGTWLL
jgi:hypothetical protein